MNDLKELCKKIFSNPSSKTILNLLTITVCYILLIIVLEALRMSYINEKNLIDLKDEIISNKQHEQALIKNALRQTFINFKTEDLLNINIKSLDKSIEISGYIEVRLKDGNLIPIGYFDNKGNYQSIFE